MPEPSVIMPVYNTEKYLQRSIEFVLRQKYDDLELIIEDDVSTDSSRELCERYAASNSRIIVIHKENEGQAVARNARLEITSGTYVGFIDSDDWISPDYYSFVINIVKKHADVVSCEYITGCNEGETSNIKKSNNKHWGCGCFSSTITPEEPNFSIINFF